MSPMTESPTRRWVKAYGAGRDAHKAGKSRDDMPFDLVGDERLEKAWTAGWDRDLADAEAPAPDVTALDELAKTINRQRQG